MTNFDTPLSRLKSQVFIQINPNKFYYNFLVIFRHTLVTGVPSGKAQTIMSDHSQFNKKNYFLYVHCSKCRRFIILQTLADGKCEQ